MTLYRGACAKKGGREGGREGGGKGRGKEKRRIRNRKSSSVAQKTCDAHTTRT